MARVRERRDGGRAAAPAVLRAVREVVEERGPAESAADVEARRQAALRVFPGGKQYINTGTWTPITSLDMSTLGHRVLRTYALIEYVDGKARASLKIWNGKPQITDDFA
jgi:hypothetical protein